MSDTIVDMPKVTQSLDAGWRLTLFKNSLGAYTAIGTRDEMHRTEEHETDDFTPEQALTRLAYKILGDVI